MNCSDTPPVKSGDFPPVASEGSMGRFFGQFFVTIRMNSYGPDSAPQTWAPEAANPRSQDRMASASTRTSLVA